eukprot:COSAG02_NODE_48467_length_333_cov_1.094017_1_plen_47_part_10
MKPKLSGACPVPTEGRSRLDRRQNSVDLRGDGDVGGDDALQQPEPQR